MDTNKGTCGERIARTSVTAILGHECALVLKLAQTLQEKLSSELNTIERLLAVQISFPVCQ
jgi:hypothetical protein